MEKKNRLDSWQVVKRLKIHINPTYTDDSAVKQVYKATYEIYEKV